MKLMKLVALPALLATLVACGGEPGEDDASGSRATTQQGASPAATVPATSRVIEVRMITNDKGNYFAPADIGARQGDVLRFTIVSGVHNVNFTPERNPGVTGLPSASELLQLLGADVLLGPTGAALQRTLGQGGGALWVSGSLLVWLAVPLLASTHVFRRRDF